MRINKLRVKDLKQLNNLGLLEEYKNFSLIESPNFNDAFFNTFSYNRITNRLYKKEISYNLLKFFIEQGVISKDVIRYVLPATKEDAFKIFIDNPEIARFNTELLKFIDRKQFSDWFDLNSNNLNNIFYLNFALRIHLINGEKLYNIINNNPILYKNFFRLNNSNGGGYVSENVIHSLNNNIYNGTTIDEIKLNILDYVEKTIKRNKVDELNYLYNLIFANNDRFYNTTMENNYNINDKPVISEKIFKIKLDYKSIFKDNSYKITDEDIYYSNIFRYLSLDEKKIMIDTILDINLDFFEDYFKYSINQVFKIIEYYLKTSYKDRKEIEFYILDKILNNEKLLNLIIKDNVYGISLLFILNDEIFKKIENNHDLLKKIFVFNNKSHYIMSRIHPDHELSKGNYNPEACYGNIWQEECSNCLFYMERNLNLTTRCAKKYEPLLDIKVETSIYYSRDQLKSKLGNNVDYLLNTNNN